MSKIHTKICGFTQPEDALMAANLGVDAIGLVFFAGSKRCVSIEQAQKIVAVLPPFVSVVALFVNETAENIHQVLQNVSIDVLQFHGDETPEFCRQFARPYLKAIRVNSLEDIQHAWQRYPDARAILFDAYLEGVYGGTGQHFNWHWLPENIRGHWILSGGLNVDNIQQALTISQANAVDVSSGVEIAAGVKDHTKMAQFLAICHCHHHRLPEKIK